MRVLIADDSAAFRELLAGRLAKIKGADLVGTAEGTQETVAAIQRLKPHVVILDLLLDRDSGVDVLQSLKNEPSPPIVIVLSNYAGFGVRKTCMELGAHCVLDKSWGVDETLSIIQELIPRFDPPKEP